MVINRFRQRLIFDRFLARITAELGDAVIAKGGVAQQRACDRWMVDFNEVLPHHVLGGKTPSEVYPKLRATLSATSLSELPVRLPRAAGF